MRENERRPSTDRLPVPVVDRNATVISVQFPPSWEPIEPVKYGDSQSMIELNVTLSSARKSADIRVANRAQLSRIALLKKEYEGITKADDTATTVFARALERLQRLPQGSTTLGLARIAMESAITLEINGDQVVMNARVQ